MTRHEIEQYVELTDWIRELSSPRLSEAENAEEYRELLLRNFKRIAVLSKTNREILDENIYPLLNEDRLLSDDEVTWLYDFYDALSNYEDMENIDAPMQYTVAKRLLKDAEQKNDTANTVRALDALVTACYTMMEMTDRLCPANDSFFRYRDEGIAAAERLLVFLDRERFAALPDEATKKIVLVMSRYAIAVYQNPTDVAEESFAAKGFELLQRARSLESDPFYREQAPSYDWKYHHFLTLEYYSNMTERNNEIGLNAEQLEQVYGYTEEMFNLFLSDPVYYEQFTRESLLRLNRYRNAYLAGRMSLEDYRQSLLSLVEQVPDDDFSFYGNVIHILAPLEYFLTIDKDNMSVIQEQTVAGIYRDLIHYVHRMPKQGTFAYMIGDITYLLAHFIQVPGGVDFETMCLELIAAIHPPTYVHSLSVADLSLCIATHLAQRKPELFEGVPGYPDRARMREVIWHAAVCHDIGKLFIVDTINMYGRNLFREEYERIQTHPVIGAYLLEKHDNSKAYANTSRLHHRFFDDCGGYPSVPLKNAADRTMIEIISCADCLDASTDDVGRSYKTGKTLDDFIGELKRDNGSRYAPYFAELLQEPEVYKDLTAILESGRESNYHKTFRMLEQVMM